MINKNIIGYEFVKNVTKAAGYEYTDQNFLFVVRRNSEDFLRDLCEVRENQKNVYRELEAKYPFEEGYIIWFGTIVPQRDGSDRIEFYWS